MAEGGKEAVRVDDDVGGSSEVRALEKRILERGRVLSKYTLKYEILREAVNVARKKTHFALADVARLGFAVKTVTDTLSVSRSQFQSRLRDGSRPQGRPQRLGGCRVAGCDPYAD